jgi:hypothetical protein
MTRRWRIGRGKEKSARRFASPSSALPVKRPRGWPAGRMTARRARCSASSHDLAYRARIRAVSTTFSAGVGGASLRQIQLGRADLLEIGTLRIRNVPIAIRNPARNGAPRWQGETLSPLTLGLSAIVDYQRRQVTLARALPEEPGKHPAYFVVDTGGEVISISAETASALRVPSSRRIPLRVFGLSGLDESAFLLPGIDLDFEGLAYRQVGLAVLNLRAPSVLLGFQVGGIVGHQLLGRYRVAFDLQRSELRLSK